MKKGWIITLLIIGFVVLLKQSSVSFAQYNDTGNCKHNSDYNTGINNLTGFFKQAYINQCIADQNNSKDWCCVCFDTIRQQNPPDICSQLYDALSGTPIPPTNIPTNTPTPTPRPVNCTYSAWSTCSASCGVGTQTRTVISAAQFGGTCSGPLQQSCTIVQNCPIDCEWGPWSACSKTCDQGVQTRTIQTQAAYGGKECTGATQTTCFLRSCSDIGSSGGFTSGGTSNTSSNALQIYLSSYTSGTTTTKTLLPTYTPVPTQSSITLPTATPIPQIDTDTGIAPPIPTNTPYIRPTSVVPTIKPYATPIPVPTERALPSTLTTATETTKEKTTTILDLKALTEIKIVPNTPTHATPTDKPFIPQEQRQLAVDSPSTQTSNSPLAGLLITLERAAGKAFVTQQDELVVKRGNQFFSISNLPTSTDTKSTQTNTSDASSKTSSAQLEINANNVIARSSMGLSIDPLSGILTVETPNGPQKVSIMPDEALGIVLELKALNASGVVEPNILLVSENGALIYRISGEKVEKFLGLFPLAVQKQILVSADTGSVVKVELSLISQILSFFTF
jgi:hypothetical protein